MRSPLETAQLGRTLGHKVRGGDIIALIGELGVGKTCFVRGLAQGMSIPEQDVTSPTFTVIQEYHSHPPLAHVDVYRLESCREIEDIGLSSYFEGEYVVVIEWADRLSPTQLPADRFELHLSHRSRYTRHIGLQAFGPRSQELLNSLMREE